MSPRSPTWRRPPSAVTTLFFLAGLWLTVSPFVLGFAWSAAALWNTLVIGVALMILAVIRFAWPRRFETIRATVLIAGAWIFASPYVVNFSEIGPATINAFVVGAITIIGAVASSARPATRSEA